MRHEFQMALERIWSLLAPIAAENLDKLKSGSAKEVSVTEMLARAHMAWEVAQDMLFAGDASEYFCVLVADEKKKSFKTRKDA